MLVAAARRVTGLAPLACKTDKIDARVLAVLSERDPGARDLATRFTHSLRAQASAVSAAPGPAQVYASGLRYSTTAAPRMAPGVPGLCSEFQRRHRLELD